jgi:protein-tyrosine-phosphatase
LKEDDKVVFWDIPDPARMADGAADEVYKEVQRREEQLVAKIG